MKMTLKLEESGMLLLAVYLFSLLDYSWWWLLALFLTPDIGMLGYLVNARTGAIIYNLLHHKGIAAVSYVAGASTGSDWLMLAGIILFFHASLDRLMGYGLKYPDSFRHTHLGIIGAPGRKEAGE